MLRDFGDIAPVVASGSPPSPPRFTRAGLFVSLSPSSLTSSVFFTSLDGTYVVITLRPSHHTTLVTYRRSHAHCKQPESETSSQSPTGQAPPIILPHIILPHSLTASISCPPSILLKSSTNTAETACLNYHVAGGPQSSRDSPLSSDRYLWPDLYQRYNHPFVPGCSRNIILTVTFSVFSPSKPRRYAHRHPAPLASSRLRQPPCSSSAGASTNARP